MLITERKELKLRDWVLAGYKSAYRATGKSVAELLH
jgi:hypothetical protein